MLEAGLMEISEEVASQYLHVSLRSGRRMVNIINELLLLASVRRMEEVELEPLDMPVIVAGAWERLADLAKRHWAEIALPDAWPVARGREAWIEEVWVNYLSNAIKYGGQPPRLELGASADRDSARFWVRDNGAGLTPEEQARLFTPFERLHQARAKGHGLGLSIVQRIVTRLGGYVGVESKEGEGSTFWFQLPLDE
jgi:signal transduction histidine kinase